MKFAKFAPKWHAKVQRGYMTKHDLDLLGEHDKCVVGEAWGWSKKYAWATTEGDGPDFCDDCDRIGDSLYETMSDIQADLENTKHIPITPMFKETIKELEKHWCSIHAAKAKKSKT